MKKDAMNFNAEKASLMPPSWDKLYAEGGDAAVNVFGDYYSMFSKNAVEWLAGLYDHSHGGFYYSNSARDNEFVDYNGERFYLLPDIESTEQALDIIKCTGMISSREHLPDKMKRKITEFVKRLQDPNGYFYHPQWGKELTDKKLSRRGRDLNWAVGILRGFGSCPTYDTPSGIKGDGILWDGSLVKANEEDASAATREKAIVSSVAVPPHLANEEAYRAYLSSKDIDGDSYTVGNQLCSTVNEVIARDRVLHAEGKDYSLCRILIDYLNFHCNSETGHWSAKANYDGVNGLLKIAGTYRAIGAPLPYPKAAARSAISAITTDEKALTVCYPYNAWLSLSFIMENVRKFNPAEAEAIISDIRGELRANMEKCVLATKKKVQAFKKEDGSFSYNPDRTSHISQAMPVALFGANEGDVNASRICIFDTTYQMLRVLGYTYVPQYDKDDYLRFLETVKL